MPAKLSGAVITAYDTLIAAFEDAGCNASALVYSTGPVANCFSVDQHGGVVFEIYLHLAEVRTRQEIISILVHAREAISPRDNVLTRSTVHVSYYRVKHGEATHLHSIHFDYDPDLAYHPWFHAQLCHDPVTLQERDRNALAFSYNVAADDTKCYRDSRIPTSDMTLPSVLLCLVADHVRGDSFDEFLAKLQGSQALMPLPTFEKLRVSIAGEPGHLRSSHWFAHMRKPAAAPA